MAYLDVFIDGFAYFSLFPYIIYDHSKCVSRLRATLYLYIYIYIYIVRRPRITQFQPTVDTTEEVAAGEDSGAAIQVGTSDSTNKMRTAVLSYVIIN